MNMNAHKDIQWGRRRLILHLLSSDFIKEKVPSHSYHCQMSKGYLSSTWLIIMHDKEEDVILNCAQECVLKLSPQPAQVGRFKSDFQIWIFYQSFTLTRQKLRAQYSRVFSSTDTAEELVKIVGGNYTLHLSLLFQCLAPTSPSLANWVENIYLQPHHHHHQGQLREHNWTNSQQTTI